LTSLCGEVVTCVYRSSKKFPARWAKQILNDLRDKRLFRDMQRVADVFVLSGVDLPEIRRLYAQALIDQGLLAPAIETLKKLVADSGASPHENSEAWGLLGRAYKQHYVNANNKRSPGAREALRRAAEMYHVMYRANPKGHLWHGINAVALLWRARRDRVRLGLPGTPRAESLAAEILAEVERKDRRGGTVPVWDLATAAEACIALGRLAADGRRRREADAFYCEAQEWLERYVASEFADAFEVASTKRQLTEVWRLDPGSAPGRTLLALL